MTEQDFLERYANGDHFNNKELAFYYMSSRKSKRHPVVLHKILGKLGQLYQSRDVIF